MQYMQDHIWLRVSNNVSVAPLITPLTGSNMPLGCINIYTEEQNFKTDTLHIKYSITIKN